MKKISLFAATLILVSTAIVVPTFALAQTPPVACPLTWTCTPIPTQPVTPPAQPPVACPATWTCTPISTSPISTYPVTPGQTSISLLSPSTGSVGTLVTITGTGFSATGNTIYFSSGALSNIASSLNGTRITFTIPSAVGPQCPVGYACPMYMLAITPGTYLVSVANQNQLAIGNNTKSNTLSFTVTSSSATGYGYPTPSPIGTSPTSPIATPPIIGTPITSWPIGTAPIGGTGSTGTGISSTGAGQPPVACPLNLVCTPIPTQPIQPPTLTPPIIGTPISSSPVSTPPVATPGTSSGTCHFFAQNLGIGLALNTQDAQALTVALSNAGLWNASTPITVYNETVASAVSGFQEKYAAQILVPNGLSAGTGFVGVSTRAELNNLCVQ